MSENLPVITDEIRRAVLREHQSKAGKARMAKLTRKQRRELARKAGQGKGKKRLAELSA